MKLQNQQMMGRQMRVHHLSEKNRTYKFTGKYQTRKGAAAGVTTILKYSL